MDVIATTHNRLYRARMARCIAGGVLIFAAIAMLVVAIVSELGPVVMAAGWLLSIAVLLLGRFLPLPSGEIAAASNRLYRQSIQLPMVGLALITPLTLHCTLMLLSAPTMSEMSRWMWISALVVGQAHLTLAWLVNRDAGRMTGNSYPTAWKPLAWGTLWKTTAASCLPSVLIAGIPPLLTFITGAAFIPLMYWGAMRLTAWERASLEWLVLAERIGLDADVHVLPWLPNLIGDVDGIRVELSGYRTMTGIMRLTMEVEMAAPGLRYLRITADPTAPAQLRIGESVADAVLRITSDSGDASALAERIRDPDCYAALMEVVHGQGATIQHGRIALTFSTTSLTPVWEALPQLIDLARLLRSPAAGSQGLVSPMQPVRQSSPAG